MLEMLAQGKSKEGLLGAHIKSSACYGSMAPRMMCVMNWLVGTSGDGSKSMLG